MTLPSTLEEAHQEIRELRRDLALEAEYTAVAKIHAAMRVSPQEALLLAILWRRKEKATHPNALIQAIWEGRDEPTNPRAFIKVLVCKTNRRTGRVIENNWGHGYYLNERGISTISAILASPRVARLDTRGQEWTLHGNMGVVECA